jgi:hypothetical protein
MHKGISLDKNKYLRWSMRLYKIISLMLLTVIVFANYGSADIIYDDPNYALRIGSFRGMPGDTVKMPIIMRNNGIDVGGFYFRIRFNFGGDFDDLLRPLVAYSDYDQSLDLTTYYYRKDQVGRAAGLYEVSPIPPNDTSYYIFAYPSPGDDTTSEVLQIRFIPPFDFDPLNQPRILSATDTSTIMFVYFEVNASASVGRYTRVRYADDQSTSGAQNQFSSADGLTTVYPEFDDTLGYFFLVGPNDTVNTAPLIAFDPASSFNVDPGTAVPTVTVTATDIDGDDVELRPVTSTMPTGASFTPNPATGISTATGTFNWTPTSSQTGQHVINFTATDGLLTGTGSLTITVGGNTGTPVVSAPSSWSATQGDLITFTVSATDPNGDDLCLEMTAASAPAGASFPTKCGTASVSGTFKWTPNYNQSGNFAVIFKATDENSLSSTATVNISVEVLQIDRLYSMSTYGPTTSVGGVPGATPVIFPIDLASSKPAVYGVNFDMYYPDSVARLDSIIVTDRTPEYMVYENIGVTPGYVRVATFGLANDSIVAGSSTAILHAYMTMDSSIPWGYYWIHFDKARESVDPDPLAIGLSLMVDSGTIHVDRYGDVNLDDSIDVADMVGVVSSIIGTFTLPPRNFATANVVRDTIVNVIDLVGIINLFFGLPIESSPAPPGSGGQFAKLNILHDELYSGQFTKLNIRGEFPDDVAGVQIQIDYDPDAVGLERPQLSDASSNFVLRYVDNGSGRIKILLYTPNLLKADAFIPTGTSDIVYLPVNVKQDISADNNKVVRITQAFISNPNAREIPIEGQNGPLLPTTFTLYQNYPNPFNPITKIEFDIGSSEPQEVKLKIYNILGQVVRTLVNESLDAGHHSVEWNATDDGGGRVATGVYLYRLEVGDNAQTKKMLLLK